jgi:hypothetical protein
VSDDHARNWYFGSGSETRECSGSVDDYDGTMTAPPIMRQIAVEEGLNVGLFRAPVGQYGMGPQRQASRP